jgi:hypothetical protein
VEELQAAWGVEARVLAEKVAEHILTCFQGQDPIVSLDPLALRPAIETDKAARGRIPEAAKIVAAWF